MTPSPIGIWRLSVYPSDTFAHLALMGAANAVCGRPVIRRSEAASTRLRCRDCERLAEVGWVA